jgi:hypothetical protein
MNVIFHMKTDQFVQFFDDWVRRHKKCVELKAIFIYSRVYSMREQHFVNKNELQE